MSKFLLIGLLILSFGAQAHKIIGGVYADGILIEGEVGFSNGVMAKPGVLVEIFDPSGNKLGETVTEEEGLFSFTATQRIEHRFKANLGSGHVMDIRLPVADLPDSLDGPITTAEPETPTPQHNHSVSNNTDLERLISKAVAQQIKPLRRELAAYKEQAKWHDVLGGIGYIFGLFGIAAWMQSRRNNA